MFNGIHRTVKCRSLFPDIPSTTPRIGIVDVSMGTRKSQELPPAGVEQGIMPLVATGESCPVTGRPFLSSPALRLERDRFKSRLHLFGESILFDRAEGVATLEDVESCFANIDRLLKTLPGQIVLVQDFSGLITAEGHARRCYENALVARQDRILGVVFVGLRPMFRLFVRMGRRLHHIPFPMLSAPDWEGALEYATSLLEGKIDPRSSIGQAEVKRPFRLPMPAFLLRGYAEELRHIVSEMPWDSDREASNPLELTHPFHDVVDAWVSVKRDLDWLDRQRRDREQDLSATARTLAESEGRYRAVFEASGTALVLYGGDNLVRMVNGATERMIGLGRSAVEGRRKWTEFVHPEDLGILQERHRLRQQDPSADQGRVECRVFDTSGREHWVEVTVEAILGTDLRVASLADRTEFREALQALQQSESRFRQILETSQEGIWTSDIAGRTTFANERMVELIGASGHDLESRSFLEILPAAAEKRLEVLQTLLEGHSVVFEGRLPRSDGKIAWAIVSASPIRSETGATTGFFAMCTDITRRHEAESGLRELARDLEDRVRERTAELEETNAELGRALRAREDFLASMSHELRTPLAVVLGVLETLRDIRDPERSAHLLDVAERNGRQLLALIEDVLDFARGRAGALSVDPKAVDAMEIVQGVAQSMELQALKAGSRITNHLPSDLPAMLADPLRLRQILTNLLVNAIRHGGKGLVELCAKEMESVLRLEVLDRGPGVPRHLAEQLFQPFVQLSPSPRRPGGTGLGLALSRQLARAMGGEVGFHPREGGGAVFWLDLPKAPRTGLSPTDSKEPEIQPLEPGRVMIIEDEQDLREILCDHLEENGWKIFPYAMGRPAMEAIPWDQPDVVVVDLGLPDMDGLELIRALACSRSAGKPAILALTGQAFPEDGEKCKSAGADRVLFKPTSLRRTERALRELVAEVRDSTGA